MNRQSSLDFIGDNYIHTWIFFLLEEFLSFLEKWSGKRKNPLFGRIGVYNLCLNHASSPLHWRQILGQSGQTDLTLTRCLSKTSTSHIMNEIIGKFGKQSWTSEGTFQCRFTQSLHFPEHHHDVNLEFFCDTNVHAKPQTFFSRRASRFKSSDLLQHPFVLFHLDLIQNLFRLWKTLPSHSVWEQSNKHEGENYEFEN